MKNKCPKEQLRQKNMLLKIGLVLYRWFRRVLMSILCVVVHVLCVFASKLLSGFFWLFGTRSDFFWWRQVSNPVVWFSTIRSCKLGCAPDSPDAHLFFVIDHNRYFTRFGSSSKSIWGFLQTHIFFMEIFFFFSIFFQDFAFSYFQLFECFHGSQYLTMFLYFCVVMLQTIILIFFVFFIFPNCSIFFRLWKFSYFT